MCTLKYKNSALADLYRPSQYVNDLANKPIDLSTNVPYDAEINLLATKLLKNIDLSAYPSSYNSYLAISNFYNIPLDNISIGYGATEIIERIFKTIRISHLYIVQPAFEMVEVYCNIYDIPHTSVEDISSIPGKSLVYVSNPNGNNGSSYDVAELIARSELVILDEVYADFYSTNSCMYNNYSNVIIIKSLSKSLGLAGLRFGFCIASSTIIDMLNKTRSNHVINAVSASLVPALITEIPSTIRRLLYSKEFLESTESCKTPVYGNYVLFTEPNYYTNRFGAKKIGNYYRMALADFYTLTSCSTSHQPSLT